MEIYDEKYAVDKDEIWNHKVLLKSFPMNGHVDMLWQIINSLAISASRP
jgi:hypothetical protein